MKKFMAKDTIVLRIEFDDWAILFNPDNGDGHTLNPVGVFIWKQIVNEEKSIPEILDALKKECEEIPENIEEDCNEFFKTLEKMELIECHC